MSQSILKFSWICALLSFLACTASSGEEPTSPSLLTVAERTDYQATATYAQVMEFCQAVAEKSDRISLQDFGKTGEGRTLPLLVISKQSLDGPKHWKQAKLPVILLIGNIHAGEVCGKEALLMLAREFSQEAEPDLLEHFILLIAPIFNADGNERFSKEHRPNQLGPIHGVGQRANAKGLDLNRDFMKLESDECQALVRLLRNWDPAVVIDTHTTNGSRHRYTLTFDGPRHPATDPKLADFVREELLPRVGQTISDTTDFEMYFYGNFQAGHTRWVTYPALPRYGAHYIGLRNRIAILSEAYAYAPYKDRVLATRTFVRHCLAELTRQHTKVTQLTKEADTNAGKQNQKIALRHKLAPFPGKVTVKGFATKPDQPEASATEPRDYEVELWTKSEVEHSVPLPKAYLFSAEHKSVVDNLQRHGIGVEELREDIELPVEVSRVGDQKRAEKPFQGHHLLTLQVHREPRNVRFTAGTMVVRTSQRLGRLAALLLEPESEDGLATWNFFGESFQAGSDFPVFRLFEPHTLLTSATRPLDEERELGRRVTYDTLYGKGEKRVDFSPPTTRVEWMADGEHYLQTREGELHKVHAISGKSNRFLDPEKLKASLAAIPSMDADQRESISEQNRFQMNPQATAAIIVHGEDLYLLPFDGTAAIRLTNTPGREENPKFSPDGQFVAYVRDLNLFVCDLKTQTEQTITRDGGGAIRNGKASWIYFEEVYHRDWRAFWWSPGSRHLAFHRFDESGMPRFHAVDTISHHNELFSMAHPKPGDPNPRVRLGVAHVSGAPVKWVDLSDYTAGGFIISHVGWQPKSAGIYFYVQDRAQTWLDFRVCQVGSTNSERLFRDKTEAWVESPGDSWWSDNEIVFLSERNGWKHLYAFDRGKKSWRAITSGEWEIRSVARVDVNEGWAYFSATERSPIATDFYRCRLDGTSMERLTKEEGSHRVTLAPVGSLAVDGWSSFISPGALQLLNTDGHRIRTLDSRPHFILEEFELGEFRHVQIPTKGGFLLEATIVKPPGFDPRKKYPVWFMTYGGPHAPTVRNAFSRQMRSRMLANLGIVVFRLDPRSASGKGAKSTWTAYRQLGIPELKDIEFGIEWLKQKPFIDKDRIGMSGHSYGGFLTAFAMTHSKIFAAGISGAPVTDWRDYDTIYTERYMNTPQDNPQGYDDTSVVKAAKNLHGKLLLLHGMMDDNVHLQNTTQLIQALQNEGKQFDVMFYPLRKHGLYGDHYNRLIVDFIKASLQLDTN